VAAPAELDGGRATDTCSNRVSGDPIENPLSVDKFERASLAPAVAQLALVNRGERTHTRHNRDRVHPPLPATTVGHLSEQLQQVTTHYRRPGKVLGNRRTQPRCAERTKPDSAMAG
jgi:hypothetical protein